MGSKKSKPIIILSELGEIFKTHHNDKNHTGVNTTIKSIETIYATVPVNKLKDYIKNCEVCSLKTTLPKTPTGKALKSTAVWGRVVMDLIDFSSTPDGEFKYIIHFKGHFFNTYAKPLISKQGEQTVKVIRKLFFTFGPPKILQSDNGREFKSLVYTLPRLTSRENLLIEYDPDEIGLVHTLPRLTSNENSLIEFDPDEISLVHTLPRLTSNENSLIECDPGEISNNKIC
ncbi:SCAN domain-containing protein 3-like [Gordionus sp. m RMFG-2023]|uniref:SCAN domain-containing protein 3-like n=1 Tax=Gordionus sp. m RMFG-2023 TaxID=3053472 RepID=UPI0031FD64AB